MVTESGRAAPCFANSACSAASMSSTPSATDSSNVRAVRPPYIGNGQNSSGVKTGVSTHVAAGVQDENGLM